MIDTHCHLTYEGLFERVEEVIASAGAAGVRRMISVGTSPEDAARAVKLAEGYPGRVYATVGLHPHNTASWPDVSSVVAALRSLAVRAGVVVAVGEMGLDLHYPDPPLSVQERAFAAQLGLMRELADAGGRGAGGGGEGDPGLKPPAWEAGRSGAGAVPGAVPGALPGVVHNREATDRTVGMIRDSGLSGERFVFHCFTGSSGELDAVLDLGAMVGFTGIVTFGNAKDLAAASDRVPLDRLLIETDSPYLTPAPFRKVRINEPRYVAEVARFLAARRGMPVEDFVAATTANAERFFRLG